MGKTKRRFPGGKPPLRFFQPVGRGLDQASFLEGRVGAVLVDGLEGAGRELDGDVALEFRHEDPLGLQVGLEDARGVGSDVGTDTAFFLGFTAAEDAGAFDGLGFGDGANSGHGLVSSLS